MANTKKTGAAAVPRGAEPAIPMGTLPPPMPDPFSDGAEPWRKWKVKPAIVAMPESPPEKGIGKRLSYCRGQLDNLSVEALARYSKNWDQEGISRTSIIRYESGETLPGARELRILCEALWVAPDWLMFGRVTQEGDSVVQDLVDALQAFVYRSTGAGLSPDMRSLIKSADKGEIERRQKMIDEARKPAARG
jgi:transcriptional regulator with XRE-family HTH domain